MSYFINCCLSCLIFKFSFSAPVKPTKIKSTKSLVSLNFGDIITSCLSQNSPISRYDDFFENDVLFFINFSLFSQRLKANFCRTVEADYRAVCEKVKPNFEYLSFAYILTDCFVSRYAPSSQ